MEHCDIENLSAFIDGELPEESAVHVRAHLEHCPSCRALADDFAALKDGFAALETKPPDTLAPGVMYKIGLGAELPRVRRVITSLVGVAACLIAVLIIARNLPASHPLNGAAGGGALESGVENADMGDMPNMPAPEAGGAGMPGGSIFSGAGQPGSHGMDDTSGFPPKADAEAPAAVPVPVPDGNITGGFSPETEITEDGAVPPPQNGAPAMERDPEPSPSPGEPSPSDEIEVSPSAFPPDDGSP
ncbi:MAG: zf-HC2 domain-containing protein [Oscillospiraceae bacterium]|jgi:anti-sigma factor RsiW|nr:zf-HC2 domain-containing protein [Oscillospiraceae bacterium]